MSKILATDINTEPGVYVESGWGHYGTAHLLDQFSDDPSALRLARAYRRGYSADGLLFEVLVDLADQLESELNDYLPKGLLAGWRGGEFYISPNCDDDPECTDETCWHWDY